MARSSRGYRPAALKPKTPRVCGTPDHIGKHWRLVYCLCSCHTEHLEPCDVQSVTLRKEP